MRTIQTFILVGLLISINILLISQRSLSQPPNWVPIPNLQYNMQVIAKLQLTSGGYSVNPDDIVGAFVGDQSRGIASPFPNGLIFMSIGSNQVIGEQVTFKAYITSENIVVDLEQTLEFQNQLLIGNPGDPFIFTYSPTTGPSLGITHQAVVRDNDGYPIGGHTIGIRLTIIQESPLGIPVYSEIHTPFSSTHGLITFVIGEGDQLFGSFSEISWSDGYYFLKMEADFDGGSDWIEMGTTQFYAVPYAFHAKTADVIKGGVNETDPIFLASPAAEINDQDIENWNHVHAWSEHIVVLQDGKVGIGITNPQSTLTVNGKITASEIEVILFPKMFKGEEGILTNLDLPDQEGASSEMNTVLNLGEVTSVLMQRMEKLTKLVLELQETNNTLEGRIRELEKSLESTK